MSLCVCHVFVSVFVRACMCVSYFDYVSYYYDYGSKKNKGMAPPLVVPPIGTTNGWNRWCVGCEYLVRSLAVLVIVIIKVKVYFKKCFSESAPKLNRHVNSECQKRFF